MEKVTALKIDVPGYSKTAEIFHATCEKHGLICVYDPNSKMGAALLAQTTKAISDGVNTLIKYFSNSPKKNEIIIKIIAPQFFAKKVERLFQEKSFEKITCVTENIESIEAFFYTDTGRLRIREVEKKIQTQSTGIATATSGRRKKVLIVDDSKTIRHLLTKVLEQELEVVACAERPSQVEDLINKHNPDVITLDIHMPEMDGVQLLQKYLPKYRIPTVMITSISMEESDHVLRALEIGAVDYIKKPSLEELDVVAPMIVEKVKTAANAKIMSRGRVQSTAPKQNYSGDISQSTIIAIGSSTGGTEALREVLTQMPSGIPPIVIVQHIPPVFSKAFAMRLNDLCEFEVKEAEDGDDVIPNRVLIAPGGTQMKLVNSQTGYKVRITDDAPVNRHKPSVDYLFDSVAPLLGKKAIGVILTGMGADGAKGLLKMRNAGARTIAQDEASCVVFGMPQAAINIGAAEHVKPLQKIAETLLLLLSSKQGTQKAVNS